MTKQIRGNACIINVHTIKPNDGKDQPPPRIGTDHDRDKMKELLDQLKFKVTVYNDNDGLNAEVNFLLWPSFLQHAHTASALSKSWLL